MPIEQEEISLQRVIGAKKDQYFLDKKSITKTEVLSLLEAAGFSRSNPYYIVKQGKINQMATAPDSQRLKLLQEIAGIKVFDERRNESEQLLFETQLKSEKILEVLEQIESRLKALDEEKEELKQYQKWDKAQRMLEYTIHDNELKETKQKLDDLSKKRDENSTQSIALQDKLTEILKRGKQIGKDVRDLKNKISSIVDEKEALSKEKSGLIKQKAKLELTVKDLQDDVDNEGTLKENLQLELSNINDQISEKEEELKQFAPQYEEVRRKEENISSRLDWLDQRRRELYAKQGRGTQFESKEQRDKWLQREINQLERAVHDKHDQIRRLNQDLANDRNKSIELEGQIGRLSQDLEEVKVSMDNQDVKLYEMRKTRESLQADQNNLWREEAALQQAMTGSKDEHLKKDQALRSITGKNVQSGIDSVRKVLDYFRNKNIHPEVLDGYYGCVIENFNVSAKFFTCVEVTAGGLMFHHVVTTDRVATTILEEINKFKMPGIVNFMPLNKLETSRPVEFESKDAIPMLKKLNFDDQLRKVYQHIFGKTLICRDMEVAGRVSKEQDCDCITMEGDQTSRRGTLTGGFYDQRQSKLELQKAKRELTIEIEEQEQKRYELQSRMNEIEQQITHVLSEIQKGETKATKSREMMEQFKADLRLKKEQLSSIQKSYDPKERSLASLQSSLDAMNASVNSYKVEMGTELLSQLSSQDQNEVANIATERKKLTSDSKAIVSERFKLEGKKNMIENELENNLKRRQDQLINQLQDLGGVEKTNQLDHAKTDLSSMAERFDGNKNRLDEIDNQLDELNVEFETHQENLEENKNQERETQDKIDHETKSLETITNKQSLLVKRKEECMKKIRDLGSLPNDSFEKYQKMNSKQLYKELNKCNTELKKYSHVNKKALEQFVSFSEEKEKLLERKAEVDRGSQAIQDMMDALDNRKYEAIQFTFKQVSKYFSEVFQKLVPGGRAQLVMRRKETESQEGGSQAPETPLVEQFSGVSIKVSFSGKAAETREMSQLSGGQKSLVALTFIFAIQKCDPAPFYLFDEIDAALDPAHRQSVANMIKELSNNAQFIITTFRPELIESAEKFYGVIFRNKVSHVETIPKEKAKNFVEDDEIHR